MDGSSPLSVVALSGSLRRDSYNTAALRAAQALAPARMKVAVHDLRDVPLYDEDLRGAGLPAAVNDLRSAIRAADGVLLATPEYNYSFSGVLKNAIDWASRPPDQPFQDKPIALLSASPGVLGGVRAQYHLRQCFVYLDAKILNTPEVMIGQAGQRFDDALALTHEPTREVMGQMLEAFARWIERIKGSRAPLAAAA